MSELNNTHDLKNEVRSVRADVHADFAELDHHLHVDVPALIGDKAPMIVAGAAVAGLMLGFLAPKTIGRLLAVGIPLALAAAYVQRHR